MHGIWMHQVGSRSHCVNRAWVARVVSQVTAMDILNTVHNWLQCCANSRGVNLGGTGGHVPPEFGVGGTPMQIVPPRFWDILCIFFRNLERQRKIVLSWQASVIAQHWPASQAQGAQGVSVYTHWLLRILSPDRWEGAVRNNSSLLMNMIVDTDSLAE